jgi:hypothetical protein
MIRLDPEEEIDDDDQPIKPAVVQKVQQLPNTSQAIYNEIDINHVHMNNLQVNLTKVDIPPEVEIASDYVSLVI